MTDGSTIAYLLINLNLSTYEEIYNNSIDIKKYNYYILTQDGYFIYHNDPSIGISKEPPSWMNKLINQKSGMYIDTFNGYTNLVCFDTSQVTEWLSIIVVPMDSLLIELSHVRLWFFFITMGLSVISIAIIYALSSQMTKPIGILLDSIKQMGKGRFDTYVDVKSNDEVGTLTKTFNELNDNLQKLIVENYEVKLSEQDAKIMALNLQFNPHFLYNTLNIINLMAIDNEQEEISKMIVSLSSILQYSLDNLKTEKVFAQDIEWLERYIYIMSMRFSDKFTVYFDIEPSVYNCITPKFFLQPLLENAIIHGLDDIQQGGIIKIKGWLEGDILYFAVEDNGKGMSVELIQKIMDGSTGRIGCANVNNQIKLLYGDPFGLFIQSSPGKGTCALVKLPKKQS